MQKCKVCLEVKPLDKFKSIKQNRNGRSGTCRVCMNEIERLRKKRNYDKNPEPAKASSKRTRVKNPKTQLLSKAKKRSEECNVPFSLTKEDFEIPEFCPVFGMKLMQNDIHLRDNSISLDRLVPSLGYVPGNVAIISYKANRAKQNLTSKELFTLASWVKEQEGGIEDGRNDHS